MTGRLSRRLSRIEAEARTLASERRRGMIGGPTLAAMRDLWAQHGYDYVPNPTEAAEAARGHFGADDVAIRDLPDDELRALVLVLKTWQARGWMPCED